MQQAKKNNQKWHGSFIGSLSNSCTGFRISAIPIIYGCAMKGKEANKKKRGMRGQREQKGDLLNILSHLTLLAF